jgi:hypothetical protein
MARQDLDGMNEGGSHTDRQRLCLSQAAAKKNGGKDKAPLPWPDEMGTETSEDRSGHRFVGVAHTVDGCGQTHGHPLELYKDAGQVAIGAGPEVMMPEDSADGRHPQEPTSRTYLI